MPVKPVQLDLFRPFQSLSSLQGSIISVTYKEAFRKLLDEDFDFKRENSGYATHNFHASPAKLPPQLPKKLGIDEFNNFQTGVDHWSPKTGLRASSLADIETITTDEENLG